MAYAEKYLQKCTSHCPQNTQKKQLTQPGAAEQGAKKTIVIG